MSNVRIEFIEESFRDGRFDWYCRLHHHVGGWQCQYAGRVLCES